MSGRGPKRVALWFALAALVGGLTWLIVAKLNEEEGETRRRGERAIPVEVVAIETGALTERRTFSGSLEARARFVVAPKIGGRLEQLSVDLADPVARGQVVATLDDDAHVQEVAAFEAELAVAHASRAQASSALDVASRELTRAEGLNKRGIASRADLDTAKARQLSARAEVAVARAEIARAEAALEGARVRLGYTRVTADWPEGDGARVVAERHADAGDTVPANAPLLSIVSLDPILGVFFVTEKNYAQLHVDQTVEITTDALPGEAFEGRIARIAPVFAETSRQARVELTVANPDGRLKPGMFIRVAVALRRVDDATVVPAMAVTSRLDQDGVFLVDEAEGVARWRPVEVGAREGDRVQISGEGLSGSVITLGQQMVEDGDRVRIPDAAPAREADAGGEAPGAEAAER